MPRRSRARPAWRSTAAAWARASPPTSSPTGCAALPSYAIECLGDVRAGGAERPLRDREPVGRRACWPSCTLTDGAAATSGVTRRGWHLIDPSTGRPARTGIVQATALAPTALEAEVRAKAALLAGPDAARDHLPHGGLLVLADGEVVSL